MGSRQFVFLCQVTHKRRPTPPTHVAFSIVVHLANIRTRMITLVEPCDQPQIRGGSVARLLLRVRVLRSSSSISALSTGECAFPSPAARDHWPTPSVAILPRAHPPRAWCHSHATWTCCGSRVLTVSASPTADKSSNLIAFSNHLFANCTCVRAWKNVPPHVEKRLGLTCS